MWTDNNRISSSTGILPPQLNTRQEGLNVNLIIVFVNTLYAGMLVRTANLYLFTDLAFTRLSTPRWGGYSSCATKEMYNVSINLPDLQQQIQISSKYCSFGIMPDCFLSCGPAIQVSLSFSLLQQRSYTNVLRELCACLRWCIPTRPRYCSPGITCHLCSLSLTLSIL